MEGFIINIIATLGYSVIFLMVFFLIYYLYFKSNGEDAQEEDKNKKLGKRILK